MKHTQCFFAILVLLMGLLYLSPIAQAHAYVHTPADDFVITVITDNSGSSSSTQFTIPPREAGTTTTWTATMMEPLKPPV